MPRLQADRVRDLLSRPLGEVHSAGALGRGQLAGVGTKKERAAAAVARAKAMSDGESVEHKVRIERHYYQNDTWHVVWRCSCGARKSVKKKGRKPPCSRWTCRRSTDG